MTLSSGSRIGSYEIVAKLGQGGMGEVYRARDSKLKREVALKVLPADVADDRERLARFQREAEVLAALNHPNIAHLYGIEETSLDGRTEVRPFIVMELVDGEDLAHRLARGALPLDEALPIARQICDALEAAHDLGIIHRDLKPANIKLRPDGRVKVLDFGLAKALDQGHTAPTPHSLANSPTITSPAMTMPGVILGTAAYMSPEQARGKPVDTRTDVWAFGCVLYEMLTAQPAFAGETITDVLGAIVRAEPDWQALPPSTSLAVRRLLRRCLVKEPSRRLRHIADARLELDADAEQPPRNDVIAAAPARSRAWMAAAFAAVAVAAAVVATPMFRGSSAVPPRLQKLHIDLDSDGGTLREPVISPDGTKVVYVGRSRLWVRALDQWTPRELAGTEAAVRPFWSPDSQWIAYVRSEALLKVPAAGGPVVRVATLPAVQAPLGDVSGAWTADGLIQVAQGVGPPLRVPAGGGEVKPFANQSQLEGVELAHISALPKPSAFLVTVRGATPGVAVLANGDLRVVLPMDNARRPSYAAGHLVFERRTPNAGLWAVRFSLDDLAVHGEPFLIGEGIEPSIAADGTLAFIATPEAVTRRLAWFSMAGVAGANLAEPREWVEGVALSRDQQRLLASASDGLWMYDVETGARSRVTTNPSDITPEWVSDDTIVFVRTEAGEPSVVLKRLASGGEERVLAHRARFPRATADGRRIVFNSSGGAASAGWQVAWLDLAEPGKIHTLPAVHDGARFPSVSPDGTLVAYVSGETGRDEVYLTSLPGGDGKWQLSNDGGGWTLFAPRGDAVFYRALDGSFMSVPVAGGKAIKVGQARKLFDWGARWAPFYEVAADGSRGVTAVPVEQVTSRNSLSIVQNWQLEFAPQ